MKMFLYVSEAKHNEQMSWMPKDLVKILHQSRRANLAHKINGVIAYKAGRYLQLVEGPSHSVDQLAINLKKDKRHKNVRTLFYSDVEKQYFERTGMKLLASCESAPVLMSFLDKYIHTNASLMKQFGGLLKEFYDVNRSAAYTVETDSFSDCEFRLKTWPNFGVVKQSPENVVLCSTLINSYQKYDDLVARHFFSDTSELDHSLRHFISLGLLKVQKIDAGYMAMSEKTHRFNATGFFRKMKSFLSLSA